MGASTTSPASPMGGRRPSHPMYVMGPFDIIEIGNHVIAPGASYGQLNYLTSIVYNNPDAQGGQENVIVDLSGYGSRSTSLAQDRVYQLAGRFVGPNNGGDPIIFYEQALTLHIGESSAFLNSQSISLLAGKVAVFGFGVVSQREEVKAVEINNAPQTNLHVTLRHTNYHVIKRERVEFETTYVVPGNAILRNTFGLLQIGREALIVGYMGGFDPQKHTWVVDALLISMSSGPQTRVNGSPVNAVGQLDTRRPHL
ncbi:hypothetical protein PtB15_2B378 [Puccinia triticina]|nr:hypothetical protein PtB15_2B378 [Puccinia triticina]